ncbi:MAG: hypothetical protein H6R17_290 [Proteobacteria bacterium]|nr:hypothetical protein [Pseudomonadota bacterium]
MRRQFIPDRPMAIVLALLFLIGFLVTMWMGLFVPLYGDEPSWKLIGSRMFADDGKLLYFFPQCATGQWIDIPLTWYPARLIDTLIYEDASNPWLLRNLSWIFFLVLLACWSAILHIVSRLSIIISGLFVTSFFSIGVLPFLMVFNRPEQSLLIWLTLGFAVMLWFDKHRVRGLSGKFLLTAFFAVLACLIAATHPKGLFFFPVLLVAWWRPVKSLPLGLGLLCVMAWSALDTTHVWQLRTACAESPWLTKVLQSLSLQPQQLWQDPAGFFEAGKVNLAAFGDYVKGIQFKDEYQSLWLPSTLEVSSSFLIGVLINALTWLPVVVAAIVVALNLGSQLWKRQAGWALMAVVLALSLVVQVFLQSNKNFYEAGIVFPVILLVCIFTFPSRENASGRLLCHVLLPLMLISGSLSAYVRCDLFWDTAKEWRSERTQGPADIAGLRGFALDQCGISDGVENLVVDEFTYHAFWQHRRPMFLTYVAGWWATGTNYAETLTKRNAGGLVTRCIGMSDDLKNISKQRDGFCCASAVDLERLAQP